MLRLALGNRIATQGGRMSNIRKLALIVLAAALAGGLGLLYWNGRTETAYLTREPLARYQQIREDDLVAVSLPRSRPAEFQVVSDKAALVGLYAAQDLAAGALLSPGMVVIEPPALRTFTTGKELPAGLRGYPLTLATDLGSVLSDADLVDLVMVNPLDGTATWLLSNVEPLYIAAALHGEDSTYILALAPEQIAVVEGALADAQTDQSGTYPKLVLSQAQNPAIPPATQYHYRELEAMQRTAP